jgi:hypothetical protein
MHRRAVERLEEADRTEGLGTIWECIGESVTVLRRRFGHRAARASPTASGTSSCFPATPRTAWRRSGRVAGGHRARLFVDVLCSVVIRRNLEGAPALCFGRDFARLGLTVIR